MRSTGARVGLLIVLAAVAAGLFVVLQDDEGEGDETTTSAQTTTDGGPAPAEEPGPEVIDVADGAPVGGVKELSFEKGDQVRILVRFDEPQEDVHIHGYDIEMRNPGSRALFDFTASLDGLYELEAHGPSGDVLLAVLRVNP